MLTFFLSPTRDFPDRLFPSLLLKLDNFDSLLASALSHHSLATSCGEKVATHLHELLHSHKASLSSEQRAGFKRMSKLVNKLGHRTSAHLRMMLVNNDDGFDASYDFNVSCFEKSFMAKLFFIRKILFYLTIETPSFCMKKQTYNLSF